MKAKDILGERICIWGNVPVSILATGTPEDVRAYCKKLIDYAGEGEGLIVDASSGVNDAKVENLRAMFEFTKEYGVYGL
ncbi:MAG: uroporphyrinogen decarboxylase family protein [Syntrophorhabdales bacterium]|jgi:uroporphyrinogen-III decarboxylase